MHATQASEVLLKENEIAARLQVSIGTIRRWRILRTGPRFIRVSKSAIRYRPADLKAYLDSRPSGGDQGTPTPQPGAEKEVYA